jgi:hypothetical protein
MEQIQTVTEEHQTKDWDYAPDQWELVKITGTDPHYRVFGSWSGGYLDGDSWRLNSGITRCESVGDYYFFYGHTGSVYKCRKDCYGIRSPYNAAELNRIVTSAHGAAENVPEMPSNLEQFDWMNK